MSHPPQLTDRDLRCLVDALCCVCVADARISRAEFSVLLNALKIAGMHQSDRELRTLVEARCREIHKAGIRKSAEATIVSVRTAGNPQLGDLICRLQATALSADGRVMDRESEVARLFRDAFHAEASHCDAACPGVTVSGDERHRSLCALGPPALAWASAHFVKQVHQVGLLWKQHVAPLFQGPLWNRIDTWLCWTLVSLHATVLVGCLKSLDEWQAKEMWYRRAEIQGAFDDANRKYREAGSYDEQEEHRQEMFNATVEMHKNAPSFHDLVTPDWTVLVSTLLQWVAVGAAARGAILCFRTLSSARHGAAVVPACAFVYCLFALYKHFL